MHAEAPRFFLGANAPSGFVSHFDQLYSPDDGWFAYILKGGPGTGKSTLMKRAAKEALAADMDVELIHCSSDANSLDAVIFPEIKACIVDGTAPHVIEPTYPGVSDTLINLGEYWDPAVLASQRQEIIAATLQNSAMHQRSQRYLSACGSLHEDTARVAQSSVDVKKALNFAANLGKKLFGGKQEHRGADRARLLSAITPDGLVYFEETLSSLCDTLYLIEDEFDAVGSLLLSELRAVARSAGRDTVSCYCPMAPLTKLDALLVPSLGIGFAITNSWHPLTSVQPYRTIHARRFMDSTVLSSRRQRLSFNRKTQRILLNEAIAYLNRAKTVHDVLESFYAAAMDYTGADDAYETIIAEILAR